MFPIWFQQSLDNLNSVMNQTNGQQSWQNQMINIFQIYNELSKDDNFDQYIMDLVVDHQTQNSLFVKSLFSIHQKIDKLRSKIEQLEPLFKSVDIQIDDVYATTVKEIQGYEGLDRKSILNKLQVMAEQLVFNMQHIMQKKSMNHIKSEEQEHQSPTNGQFKLTRKVVKRLVRDIQNILQFYKNAKLKYSLEICRNQELQTKVNKIVNKFNHFQDQGLMQHIIEFVRIKQEIKFLNYRLYKVNKKQRMKDGIEQARMNSATSLDDHQSGSSFSDDKFIMIQNKHFQDICIKSYSDLSNRKKKKSRTNRITNNVKDSNKQVRSLSLLQKAKDINSQDYELQKLGFNRCQQRHSVINLVQDIRLDSIKERNETSLSFITNTNRKEKGENREKGCKSVFTDYRISSCNNCNIM